MLRLSFPNRTFQAHLTNVENRDKILTYIVLPSLLSPAAQTAIGRKICITKGLSWHTLAEVIVRAPVGHTAGEKKPSGGQLRSGGYGKSLGVGGKMPLMSLCGLERHAHYFLRAAINAPSVSSRLWHCELRQPQDRTKCLLVRKSCSVSLVVTLMTSFLRRTDPSLRCSLVVTHLTRRHFNPLILVVGFYFEGPFDHYLSLMDEH